MDRLADAVEHPSRLAAAADRVETAPLDATQLWERHGAQVYKFAAMVCQGDMEAEDLAQEALLRAIRALPRFQPRDGGIEAWLWRIVVNTARDLGRVAKRRTMLLERLRLDGGPEPSVPDDVDARLTSSELMEAVRALNARRRTMIALRFASDLDYPTIGRILGLTPAGARAATRRALAALREHLEAPQARSEIS